MRGCLPVVIAHIPEIVRVAVRVLNDTPRRIRSGTGGRYYRGPHLGTRSDSFAVPAETLAWVDSVGTNCQGELSSRFGG
jgi:hypothetical protein